MRGAPTSLASQYEWFNLAIKGKPAPVFVDLPQCGWFKRRLIKGGPLVPARIWLYSPTDEIGDLVGDERLLCDINGTWADAEDQWQWLCQSPIPESEYRYMMAMVEHATCHEPDHPAANPNAAIDNLKTPLHF